MIRRNFMTACLGGAAWLLGANPTPRRRQYARTWVVVTDHEPQSGIAYASYETVKQTGYAYLVTCNGELLKSVKEANATEGWAICYSHNEKGQKYAAQDAFGEWYAVTHKVRGNIVITKGKRFEGFL